MEQHVRVLIADDQPRARHSMKALLGTFQVGAQKTDAVIQVVGEAEDGEEAIRLADEMRPDVVIMDAQMPVMNGLDATRVIKDRCPSMRVVVLTMYKDLEQAALEAGADVFLLKGCDRDELREAITSPSPRATLTHFKAEHTDVEPAPGEAKPTGPGEDPVTSRPAACLAVEQATGRAPGEQSDAGSAQASQDSPATQMG